MTDTKHWTGPLQHLLYSKLTWVLFCGWGSSALQFVEPAGESGSETTGDRGEFTGTETQTGPAGLAAHTLTISDVTVSLSHWSHVTVGVNTETILTVQRLLLWTEELVSNRLTKPWTRLLHYFIDFPCCSAFNLVSFPQTPFHAPAHLLTSVLRRWNSWFTSSTPQQEINSQQRFPANSVSTREHEATFINSLGKLN